MGYEDCNDGDWLRHDPAFQFACDSEGRPISSLLRGTPNDGIRGGLNDGD
jgi:hypothetical protein